MSFYVQPTNPAIQGLQSSAPKTTFNAAAMAAPVDKSQFQFISPEPPLAFKWADRMKQFVLNPIETSKLKKKMQQYPLDSGLTLNQQVMMYGKLNQALDIKGKGLLADLLNNGRLFDTSAEDHRTTLYHLYSILTTPRAGSLNGRRLVNEMVTVLDKPFEMSQTFAKLSEQSAKQILMLRNNPNNFVRIQNPKAPLPADLAQKPLNWMDIDVSQSANCVPASVMYYMAQKNPSELTRQIKELTSPAMCFYETAKLSDISPRYPQNGVKKLQDNKVDYTFVDGGTVKIKVKLPPLALIHTQNASAKEPQINTRNGVASAYHSALISLATKERYDPATDYRWDDSGQLSVGLTEYEKTLLESIIKDNGGVVSVTYQAATGKANPTPQEEGLPFLYGYTRTFEQTTQDMINALKQGEPVIIGITDTLPNGVIPAGNGHEVTLVGAFADPNGELMFRVMDTDDNIPTYVVRAAREIIPKIHHAGVPASIGLQVQDEIWSRPGYFIPTPEDQAFFDPLAVTTEPLPEDAIIFFDDDYQQFMAEQQTAQQMQQPQPASNSASEQLVGYPVSDDSLNPSAASMVPLNIPQQAPQYSPQYSPRPSLEQLRQILQQPTVRSQPNEVAQPFYFPQGA